jgi:chromosome segregation ATPase
MLDSIYIYTGSAFLIGFILAWVIRTLSLVQLNKKLKSVDGYLDSEKLKKETLQKENVQINNMRLAGEHELMGKLKLAQKQIQEMDRDILLLQQSNEETEAQLLAGQPEIHALKIKLIEAQNTIARLKGNA